MNSPKSLSAAVLTPQGRGAVAVIKFDGDIELLNQQFLAKNKLPVEQQALQEIRYGQWGNELSEDVVIVRTSEQTIELHCHGGMAAVNRVLHDVRQHGVQLVRWQQLSTEKSEIEIDGETALLRATTLKTAKLLLRQNRLFSEAIQHLKTLDSQSRVLQINDMLKWKNFALHLTSPWQVVLCGRPNVGKSSLINALVGYSRSVVFDQPGTTRDVVSEQTALDGWPIEFSDTAGIRETAGEIESQGIALARTRLEHADLQVIVLDALDGITDFDHQLMCNFPNAIKLWNKIDLRPDTKIVDGIAVSAKSGEGIQLLQKAIVQQLIPTLPSSDAVYPVTSNQVAMLENMLL